MLTEVAFTQSKMFAETNAAYLRDAPKHMPPLFWSRVGRVSSQILKMLLPLYNVCGIEFSDKPPAFEHFAQAVYTIVAYAGWLNVVNRMSPGVLNIIWSGPGKPSSSHEKMILEDVFRMSEARAKSKNTHGEKRIKISACPYIVRLSLDEKQPDYHKVYIIQQPRAVYYSGGWGKRQPMALSDYVASVRRPKGTPPTSLVLFIVCVFGVLLWLLLKTAIA